MNGKAKEGDVRFDLLIRGGYVVDPSGGHEGHLDVAIEGGRIAAVDATSRWSRPPR